MSHILIKCKECMTVLDTGVSMDFESFCTSELENIFVVCHSKTCGKKIAWSKDDFLAISFC